MNMNACAGCKYWRSLAAGDRYAMACHYALDTGKPRGCDPGAGCDKRDSQKGEKKRTITSTKTAKRQAAAGARGRSEGGFWE